MDSKTLTTATYVTIGLGMLLLVTSYLLVYLFPERGAWSEENAQEHAESAADLHRLTHMHSPDGHSHGDDAPSGGAAELEAARVRYAESETKLSSAIAGRQRVRTIVRWLGITLALAGMGLGIFVRLRETGT
jgi:hypothetical protein